MSQKKPSLKFVQPLLNEVKKNLEPAMFCHLGVLIYLCGGKRPKVVYAKQKGSKNFFTMQ